MSKYIVGFSMKSKVVVEVHKIKRLGFYERGRGSSVSFGDYASIVEDLYEWLHVEERTLEDTSTLGLANRNDQVPSVYCPSMVKDSETGDFLMITWNEVASKDGSISVLPGDALVETTDISTTETPEGGIPGHASYFWLIPDSGLDDTDIFVTLKFENFKQSTKKFKEYIRNFMKNFSKYTETSVDENSNMILKGYREDPQDTAKVMTAKFQAHQMTKKGLISEIRANREKITKIVKKDVVLDIDVVDNESGLLDKMLQKLGLQDVSNIEEEIKLKFEIPFTPDETELDDMIEYWESEHGSLDASVRDYDDIGFVMSGDPNPRWLGKSKAKGIFDLELEFVNAEIVDLEKLKVELRSIRDTVINLARKETE